MAVLLVLSAVRAQAQDQDSVFRSLAKKAGLATDVAPPPDFVLGTRPAEPPGPIFVFSSPDEPSSKVMTPAQLKAMDADLETAGKRHDVLRAGFAPSAKAVADAKAEAAEKARRRKKPHDAAEKPTP